MEISPALTAKAAPRAFRWERLRPPQAETVIFAVLLAVVLYLVLAPRPSASPAVTVATN